MFNLEIDYQHRTLSPEERLWLAALCLLIEDARRYKLGTNLRMPIIKDRGMNAFYQVRDCGEHLQYICDHLPNYDAEILSQAFRRWLKAH